MKSIRVFMKDLQATFRNPKVFVPVLVVLFIPVLYSGMFLTAFWDPYSKMSELPVAVVNQDKGATFEDKTLTVGKDLIEELKKGKDFDWKFVSSAEAEQGTLDNKYYMTIVIPEDFSSKATSLMDENPEPAKLVFEPNEGYNFLAAQIGGTAVKEMKTKVSAKVTEAYTETLFDQVEKLSGGLSEAGDGAGSLNTGALKLDEGTVTLKENLAKLVKGTTQLQSGVAPLEQGAVDLRQGAQELHSGVSTLADGLGKLEAAGKQLETGAVKAQSGSATLQEGLTATLEGTKGLQTGLTGSEQGAAKLVNGLESSVQGSQKVAAAAKSLAQGLEQLSKANPELAGSREMKELLAASQAVAVGSGELSAAQEELRNGGVELHAAQKQLLEGSSKLVAGEERLVQGAVDLSSGQSTITDGLKLLTSKLSEAATGGQQLADGAGKLSQGAVQLAGGMDQLTGGVTTIASGSQQLEQGAGKLKSGMDELSEGSGELASKLSDAAEKSAAVKKSDALVNMYAQPIEIEEHKVNEVPNYGTGFTPYFLSLGLFVGALISTLVVSVRGSAVSEASGWNRFVSRSLAFTGMSLVQSVLASALVLYALGLHVQSVPMFYLFSFVTSLCFMFIIQALVTWLDNPGRFVAILMLIFQLTTSAGTFPLELIPDWMKAFNPLLPMTYSVTGYKAIVSSGDFGTAWQQIFVLAGFGVVFLALTLTYFLRRREEAGVRTEAALNI